MRVTFLGTGSAMPTGDRVQTGLLVEDDDDRLLVDCGSGVLHRLARTDAGYEGVDTVLLTHHHTDHVADLLPLIKARWLAGEEHLTVVGPPGTEDLVDGLLEVHDYLAGRIDLTCRDLHDDEFASEGDDADPDPFEVAGVAVAAHETRHSMQCLAYRFDDRFTFSADTEAFDALAAFAEGSAVLAHDCSFPDEVDVSNHPTPSQLGDVLAGHDLGRVYLTHLYPHTEGHHEEMVASVREAFDGDVRVADDMLSVSVDRR